MHNGELIPSQQPLLESEVKLAIQFVGMYPMQQSSLDSREYSGAPAADPVIKGASTSKRLTALPRDCAPAVTEIPLAPTGLMARVKAASRKKRALRQVTTK